jgi:hypothetical protein
MRVQENANATSGDIGPTTSGFCHRVNTRWNDGSSFGNYASATCNGVGGFGAAECTGACDCNVTLTLSVGIFTVSSSGKVLYASNTPILLTCEVVADPQHLISISVTPSTAAGSPGGTQSFTALGNYSGGRRHHRSQRRGFLATTAMDRRESRRNLPAQRAAHTA